MDIWESNKLLLFIAFVVPGFVSLKVYQVTIPSDVKDSSKLLIDAVVYSCINYSFILPLIYYAEYQKWRENHYGLYLLGVPFVTFILPGFMTRVFIVLRMTEHVQDYFPNPYPRSWPYVFSQRKSFYLKIHLKNEKIISGLYSENSFASSDPASFQIYLEKSYYNEGEPFTKEIESTEGVLVLTNDIDYIEFYSMKGEDMSASEKPRNDEGYETKGYKPRPRSKDQVERPNGGNKPKETGPSSQGNKPPKK